MSTLIDLDEGPKPMAEDPPGGPRVRQGARGGAVSLWDERNGRWGRFIIRCVNVRL